jgi:LuxR family transcriptional regulator, regulator of acetate metabolism
VDDVVERSREERRRAGEVRGHVSAGVRSALRAEWASRSRVVRASPTPDALTRLVAVADELREVDAHEERTTERTRTEIQRSLGRLRRCDTIDQLVRLAPVELRRACGFSRAMISRVDGSSWVPVFPPEGRDDDADALRARFGEQFVLPMQHMLLEAEMVRRRIPLLVEDAVNDPRVHEAFVTLAGARDYVGAPIVSGRQVIGFLHADRRDQEHAVTVADREAIRIFARHFGLLHDRAAIAEELRRRHEDIARRQRAMADELSALVDSRLVFLPPVESDVWRPKVERDELGDDGPAPATLTVREREILTLVASGATNQAIARELVVSPNTVKTHVARASRKLRAHSRAEAVARFLQSTEYGW